MACDALGPTSLFASAPDSDMLLFAKCKGLRFHDVRPPSEHAEGKSVSLVPQPTDRVLAAKRYAALRRTAWGMFVNLASVISDLRLSLRCPYSKKYSSSTFPDRSKMPAGVSGRSAAGPSQSHSACRPPWYERAEQIALGVLHDTSMLKPSMSTSMGSACRLPTSS